MFLLGMIKTLVGDSACFDGGKEQKYMLNMMVDLHDIYEM